jgi:hypothetical protein
MAVSSLSVPRTASWPPIASYAARRTSMNCPLANAVGMKSVLVYTTANIAQVAAPASGGSSSSQNPRPTKRGSRLTMSNSRSIATAIALRSASGSSWTSASTNSSHALLPARAIATPRCSA